MGEHLKMKKGHRFKDKTGQRFGRLVAVRTTTKVKGAWYWECRCDCGNVVSILGSNLNNKKNNTTSCGCYNSDIHTKPDNYAAITKLFNNYKYTAKKKGRTFGFSRKEFVETTSKECYYCGASPRLDNTLGYTLGNCVPCCTVCNYAKRDMTEEEFYSWIDAVYWFSVGGNNAL